MAYQAQFIVSKVQPGLVDPADTPTQQIAVHFTGERGRAPEALLCLRGLPSSACL